MLILQRLIYKGLLEKGANKIKMDIDNNIVNMTLSEEKVNEIREIDSGAHKHL